MLKNEGEIRPTPQEIAPEGFMGMIVSNKPFISNNADGEMITVFDVHIEKGEELLERRVELRGRKVKEIDDRLIKGQEVIIMGHETHEPRIPDRYGKNHEYIDAVEIELPKVVNPNLSYDKEKSQAQDFTGTIVSNRVFIGYIPGDKEFATFDVKIRQGEELIKRRVIYFGDLEEIMPNLKPGQEVNIFGVEFTERTSRRSGRGKRNQKKINANKLDFPKSSKI